MDPDPETERRACMPVCVFSDRGDRRVRDEDRSFFKELFI